MRGLIFLCALVFGCAVDAGEAPGSNEEELTKQCTLAAASHRSGLGAVSGPCCSATDNCYVDGSHYYCNTYEPYACFNSQPNQDGSIATVVNLVQGLHKFATTLCANLTPESQLQTSTLSRSTCGILAGPKTGSTGFFPRSNMVRSVCVHPSAGDGLWLHRAERLSSAAPCEAQVNAVGP